MRLGNPIRYKKISIILFAIFFVFYILYNKRSIDKGYEIYLQSYPVIKFKDFTKGTVISTNEYHRLHVSPSAISIDLDNSDAWTICSHLIRDQIKKGSYVEKDSNSHYLKVVNFYNNDTVSTTFYVE